MLNEYSQEEFHVEQPPDFENPNYYNHVFKLYEVLYRLEQAPRVRYKGLVNFLFKNYLWDAKLIRSCLLFLV